MQETVKEEIIERGLIYRQLISNKAFQYLVDEVNANIEDTKEAIVIKLDAGNGDVALRKALNILGMRDVINIPFDAVEELKQLEDSEAS